MFLFEKFDKYERLMAYYLYRILVVGERVLFNRLGPDYIKVRAALDFATEAGMPDAHDFYGTFIYIAHRDYCSGHRYTESEIVAQLTESAKASCFEPYLLLAKPEIKSDEDLYKIALYWCDKALEKLSNEQVNLRFSITTRNQLELLRAWLLEPTSENYKKYVENISGSGDQVQIEMTSDPTPEENPLLNSALLIDYINPENFDYEIQQIVSAIRERTGNTDTFDIVGCVRQSMFGTGHAGPQNITGIRTHHRWVAFDQVVTKTMVATATAEVDPEKWVNPIMSKSDDPMITGAHCIFKQAGMFINSGVGDTVTSVFESLSNYVIMLPFPTKPEAMKKLICELDNEHSGPALCVYRAFRPIVEETVIVDCFDVKLTPGKMFAEHWILAGTTDL